MNRLVLGLLGLGFLIGCGSEEEPAPTIPSESYTPPAEAALPLGPLRFTDVTEPSGVAFRHHTGGFRHPDGGHSRWLPECIGAGVAVFDADGDGDLDLFFAQSGGFPSRGQAPKRSAFFRNLGGWRFEDASREVGLDLQVYGMGASAADYDGDGDQDLCVTTWGGPRLLRNEDGRFRDVTDAVGITSGWKDEESGRSGPDWSTSAGWFDADQDGDLDLMVTNYVRWTPETDVFDTLDGKTKSFTIPDKYHGNSCRLFLQEEGRFRDATKEAGVLNPDGKSLGLAFWDFEGDGRMDFVVANDQQPNYLYQNLGGKFVDRGEEAGLARDENGDVRAGMGIDIADYLNDGIPGISIGNFSGEPVALYRMDQPWFCQDETQPAGVARETLPSLTFGLQWADLDLDGWQDLVLGNGHLEPLIQDVMPDIPWAQPPLALRNLGGTEHRGRFARWDETIGGDFSAPMVARGLVCADLDGDGDLDLILSANDGEARLLRNDREKLDPPAHFLRVHLIGRAPNTDAIGAWIEVEAGGMVQRRLVRSGSSYASSLEFTQTFGLGSTAKVDALRVRWPDGEESVRENVPVDQTLVIGRDG